MDTETTIQINELHQLVSSLEARLSTLEQTYNSYMPTSSGEDTKIEDVLTDDSSIAHGAFAVVDGKITNRNYMVARSVYTVSGNDSDATDGTWYLVVPHAAPSSATLTTSPSGIISDTQTVIPLFTIYDGEITQDYRGMPMVMIRE